MYEINQFTDLIEIQNGTFSKVYKATHNGKVYALKKCHYYTSRDMKRIKNEIKINSILDHPFIAKMYGHFPYKRAVYLVFEYCKNGDLFENQPISKTQIQIYAKQLILALQYCHDKGIIHRDLKPENVLYFGDCVKLCDFGYAKRLPLSKFKNIKMTHIVGTNRFMPPEMKIEKCIYTYLCDIWSLGCLIADLIFNEDYNLEQDSNCFNDIRHGIWPSTKIPLTWKNFIHLCLRKNPKERISLEEMLDHPFITKIDFFE